MLWQWAACLAHRKVGRAAGSRPCHRLRTPPGRPLVGGPPCGALIRLGGGYNAKRGARQLLVLAPGRPAVRAGPMGGEAEGQNIAGPASRGGTFWGGCGPPAKI